MMTRKNYEKIADILHEASNLRVPSKVTWIMKELGDYFEGDSPRFDRSKFYERASGD